MMEDLLRLGGPTGGGASWEASTVPPERKKRAPGRRGEERERIEREEGWGQKGIRVVVGLYL
jgi:hypothetical protein